MTTTNRIPAPPTPMRPPATPPATPPLTPFVKTPTKNNGHRFLIYGQGGLGKTRLCCAAPGPIVFFDFDESLGILWDQLSEQQKQNMMMYTPKGWQDFMDIFQKHELFTDVKTIVIDTVTVAERAIEAWILETIHAPNGKANSIEDYGYGKGYTFIYEQWTKLLSISDTHIRAGRNIVLVAHASTSKMANPSGEDYIRVTPAARSDKSPIRERLPEWVDHCIYLDWDKAISKDGKVTGGNSRTIYTHGQNWFVAKTRGKAPEFIYPDVNNLEDVWKQLFE